MQQATMTEKESGKLEKSDVDLLGMEESALNFKVSMEVNPHPIYMDATTDAEDKKPAKATFSSSPSRLFRRRVSSRVQLLQYAVFCCCLMLLLQAITLNRLEKVVRSQLTARDCPIGDEGWWIAYKQNCYIDRRQELMNYTEAMRDCASLNATLASPRDFEEYIMLYTLATGTKEVGSDMIAGGLKTIPSEWEVRHNSDFRAHRNDEICTFWVLGSQEDPKVARFGAFDCNHRGHHICAKNPQPAKTIFGF